MSTFTLIYGIQSWAHTWLLYTHTHALYHPYFHSTSIICGCDNVTCDPCESPWTEGSWPVKPLNVFHMFLHMSGCAPYAPLSHSSLSHTIYWISNSDSMASYNPRTSLFLLYWSSFWLSRFPAGLVLAHNTYPCLTLSPELADSLMTTDSFLVFLHENKAG